jgi:hypothetical protein
LGRILFTFVEFHRTNNVEAADSEMKMMKSAHMDTNIHIHVAHSHPCGDKLEQVQVEAWANAELPLWLCKALVSKDLVAVKRPTFLGERCALNHNTLA